MSSLFDNFKNMAKTAQGVHADKHTAYPGTDEAEPAYISGAVMSQPTQNIQPPTVGTVYRPTSPGIAQTCEYPLNIAIIQKLVTYDVGVGGIQQPAIAYMCQIAGKMPAMARRKFYGLMPDSNGTRSYKEVPGDIGFDARTDSPIVLTSNELHSILQQIIRMPNSDKLVHMVGASFSSDGKGGVRIYDIQSAPVGVADKVPYGNKVLTRLKPEFASAASILGFVDTFKYPALY